MFSSSPRTISRTPWSTACGVGRRANDQSEPRPKELALGQIHELGWLFAQAAVLSGLDHTDDFSIFSGCLDDLAERGLAGPKALREAPVDNNDGSSGVVVQTREGSSLEEIDSHRLQIAVGDDGVVQALALSLCEFVAGNVHASVTITEAERNGVRESDRGHIGASKQLVGESIVELPGLRLVETLEAGVQRGHHQVLGRIHTGIDLGGGLQRAYEESRANEQNDGERHLKNNETAAHARTSASLTRFPPHCGHQVRTRRLKSGSQPEDQSGCNRDSQGEQQHGVIDTDLKVKWAVNRKLNTGQNSSHEIGQAHAGKTGQ